LAIAGEIAYYSPVCLRAAWIRSRAVMLHCKTSLTDPGSNPGAGTVNQTVHPTGVGKLVAISIQLVTAVEGCEGKGVRLYDGRRAAYAVCGADYRTLVSCSPHGSVRNASEHIRAVNCTPLPYLTLQVGYLFWKVQRIFYFQYGGCRHLGISEHVTFDPIVLHSVCC
jgi:hypothetical protein